VGDLVNDYQYQVLIVDDETNICGLLRESLSDRGYRCTTAQSAAQALERLNEFKFDVALLDVRMPGMSGVELLSRVKSSYPNLAVIMLTAVDEVDTAVETMKAGASDYITKPFDLDRVDKAVRASLEKVERDQASRIEKVTDENVAAIEAIARGVEARQEMLDVHSEIVVRQTIDIARQMGLPESKIAEWTAKREEQRLRKVKRIVSSLIKPVQESLTITNSTENHSD
jgi:DNA-binding NtrC family response regulator